MTVRNIRAHQSRGLLPPPEVRARTGYYGPEHVARLRLIQELQGNGYNLAAIKDLVNRTSGSSQEALDFARALLAPFEDERPEVIDAAELAERFAGRRRAKLLRRAEKLGIVVPLGEGRFEIPSPTLLRAGETLIGLGIPLEKALDVIESVARQADSVADAFVKLFLDRVWKPFDQRGPARDGLAGRTRRARAAAPARHRGARGDLPAAHDAGDREGVRSRARPPGQGVAAPRRAACPQRDHREPHGPGALPVCNAQRATSSPRSLPRAKAEPRRASRSLERAASQEGRLRLAAFVIVAMLIGGSSEPRRSRPMRRAWSATPLAPPRSSRTASPDRW